MKKLIATAVVMAFVLISTGAMAITLTINYGSGDGTGAKDNGGAYLRPVDLVEIYWAGNNDAISGSDDVLLDQTEIDWGRFGGGTYVGEWTKEFTTTTIPSVTEHNYVYVKVYDDKQANKASAMFGFSSLHQVTSFLGVNTIRTPNLVTNLPEPSIILVSGLALFLVRMKRR